MKKILVSTLSLVFVFAPVIHGASLQDVQKSCESGNGDLCFAIGHAYYGGEAKVGIEKDLTKAVYFYKKACGYKDVRGCVMVGFSYHEGTGVKQDFSKAAPYFKKACDGGVGEACSRLAAYYLVGAGVTKDETKAGFFLEKACAAGDKNSCKLLKTLIK